MSVLQSQLMLLENDLEEKSVSWTKKRSKTTRKRRLQQAADTQREEEELRKARKEKNIQALTHELDNPLKRKGEVFERLHKAKEGVDVRVAEEKLTQSSLFDFSDDEMEEKPELESVDSVDNDEIDSDDSDGEIKIFRFGLI
jgi:hypothetical protein